MRWAWEEGRVTAKKKKKKADGVGEWWGSSGGPGGLCALFFLESSLKTTDTWYRIPLRVQEGGQRFIREHTHREWKLNTQPHKRQHKKRGTLKKPAGQSLDMSAYRSSKTSPKYLWALWERRWPHFPRVLAHVGGDCRGMEVAGISPTCNLLKVDWQVPGTFPPFSCGAQSWCLVGKLG